MANQILKKFIAPDAVDGSKIKLLNNQALRARNAAGAADLEILKINVSDQIEILQSLSMASHRIVSVLDPESAQDAATKAYVDNAVAGLSWKQAVNAASTADVDKASAPSSIDNYSMSNGDRILLKNQTVESENGVYVFNGAGNALTRASDMNSWNEIVGSVVYVISGDVNAGSKWVSTNVKGGTLESSNVSFTMFAAASALEGVGSAGYVSYWSGSHTLSSEQYLSQSRGGFGQDASSLGNGVLKKSSGSYVSAAVVDADVSATAAIAFSKMASLTASKALVSDASGVVSASSITATELGYLANATSEIQGQLNNKASTTLNNLGTTSINAHLLVSAGNSWDLGASGVGFRNLYLAGSAFVKTINAGSTNNLSVASNNQTGSTNSGTLDIASGATVDGNSGAVTLRSGTVSGTGTRGNVSIFGSSVILGGGQNGGSVQFQINAKPSADNVRDLGASDLRFANIYALSLNAGASSLKLLGLNLGGAGIIHSDASGNISSSTIVDADIDAAAAIAYSKLNLAASIMDADVNSAAAIAYSKLNLAASIVDADVSATAAIAYSKLDLAASIVDADISATAAIAYEKLDLAGKVDLESDMTGVLPVAHGGTGLSALGSANQLIRVNAAGDALEFVDDEGTTMNKESFTLDSMDISNQYVDLDFEVNQNSIMAFVGRLALHKDEDYSVSVVSGKTRITFANSIASGGDEALVAGDKLFFTYNYTA